MGDKHFREDTLWEYFDGHLEESQAAEIRVHLSHCETCQALLADLKSFDKEIEQNVLQEPSMRFSKNVMELIEEEVSRQYVPIIKSFWGKLTAVGIGAVLIAFLFTPTFVEVPQDFQFINEGIGFLEMLLNPTVLITVGSLAAFWALYATDRFFLSKALRRK